jgi:membrane protein required for colicin V production
MSFYDIVMLVVLLGAMLFGYWKGLAWQIASVAAVVVSYIVAYRFRDQVAQYIQAEPPFDRIGAMLILFVGCSLAVWLAYAYINKSLEKAELDGFNRQMGALVGGVTGILLAMVITLFSVSMLGESAHDSIHHSKIGPYVVKGMYQLKGIIPEEIAEYVNPHLENFEQHSGHGDLPINQFQQYQNGYQPGFQPQQQTTTNQYPNGGTFTPASQPSFQGNWQAVPDQYPSANQYNQARGSTQQPNRFAAPANNGWSNQPATNQGNAGTGFPPIQIKLDTEDIIRGAGDWLKNSISDPSAGAQQR